MKPSDNKREEFRKYLEQAGVIDALTKALVSLYEEPDKPANALDYLRNKLCSSDDGETMDSLRTKLDESLKKVEDLQKEVADLKNMVPPEEQPADPPAE